MSCEKPTDLQTHWLRAWMSALFVLPMAPIAMGIGWGAIQLFEYLGFLEPDPSESYRSGHLLVMMWVSGAVGFYFGNIAPDPPQSKTNRKESAD